MNIDGMSYRQWQKRNTDAFKKLSKEQQQLARQQGYFNVSWQKVQQSWTILQQLNQSTQPTSLFDAKLKKGDVVGALNQSILEAEQAQQIAKQEIANLQDKRDQIKELAENTLNKYQLL
jgi:hypothetical protein